MKYIVLLSLLLIACEDSLDLSGSNETFKDYSNVTINTTEEVVIEQIYQPHQNKTILIASHYVNDFTEAKVNNNLLFNEFINLYNNYNIILIQGVEDVDVPARLANTMGKRFIVSEQVGETFDKLYYSILYDNSINIEEAFIYESINIKYKPQIILLNSNDYRFALVNVLTNQEDAQEEIRNLERVVIYLYAFKDVDDVFILGNLWGDCEYYSRGVYLKDYEWLINSNTDVDKSGCTYSNIINVKENNVISRVGINELNNINISSANFLSSEYILEMELKI